MSNTVERTVIDGKEVAVRYSRSAYAGEWVRESFAAAGDASPHGLLVGYTTDRRGQFQPAMLSPESMQNNCSVFGTTGAGKTK